MIFHVEIKSHAHIKSNVPQEHSREICYTSSNWCQYFVFSPGVHCLACRQFLAIFGYFGVFTTSLFAHLGPIASLADKRAAATRSFREHDPVGVLRCSLHKLLDNMMMVMMMVMVMMRNVFVEYDWWRQRSPGCTCSSPSASWLVWRVPCAPE